jgi:hypothetical protein
MKTRKQYSIAFGLALIAGLVVFGHFASTVRAQPAGGCSTATLEGDYLLTGRADSPNGQLLDTYPRIFVGIFRFDGKGGVQRVHTQSFAGVVTSRSQATLTYTLDSDCTGTLTGAAGDHWDLYANRNGKEGATIRIDDGNMATRYFTKR